MADKINTYHVSNNVVTISILFNIYSTHRFISILSNACFSYLPKRSTKNRRMIYYYRQVEQV